MARSLNRGVINSWNGHGIAMTRLACRFLIKWLHSIKSNKIEQFPKGSRKKKQISRCCVIRWELVILRLPPCPPGLQSKRSRHSTHRMRTTSQSHATAPSGLLCTAWARRKTHHPSPRPGLHAARRSPFSMLSATRRRLGPISGRSVMHNRLNHVQIEQPFSLPLHRALHHLGHLHRIFSGSCQTRTHNLTGTHDTTAHLTIASPIDIHTNQAGRLIHTTNAIKMAEVITNNSNNNNTSKTKGNKGAHLHHDGNALVMAKILTWHGTSARRSACSHS